MKVGAFGFTKQPEFLGVECQLFDQELGNWEINSNFPEGEDVYDAIVCTRVAYFAADPLKLIVEFHRLLKPGGRLMIDWGIGDHWRYPKFRMGWKSHPEGPREAAYGYPLMSAIWDDSLDIDIDALSFREWCIPHGYPHGTSIAEHLEEEVDCLRYVSEMMPMFQECSVEAHAFWPDSPQLYIILSAVIEK